MCDIRRHLLFCVLGGFAVLWSWGGAYGSETHIRKWPYPFSHVITYSSDADMMQPWYGAAFHNLVNNQLGLSLSDSMWVSASRGRLAYLFEGSHERNTQATNSRQDTSFGLLVREWHRGNIDHFHSWQGDSWVRLLDEMIPSLAVGSQETITEVRKVPSQLASSRYTVLRLVFNNRPPADLNVLATDTDGRTAHFKRIGEHRISIVDGDISVSLMAYLPDTDYVVLSDPAFSLGRMEGLRLWAPSCVQECDLKLLRVERDGFSREVAATQLPFLEALNIRPAFLTSHGGYTYAQNFAYRRCCAPLPATPGTVFEEFGVSRSLSPGAAREMSPNYHEDLLAKLGVLAVWPIRSDIGLTAVEPGASLYIARLPGSKLYAVPRTHLSSGFNIQSVEQFVESVDRLSPVPLGRKSAGHFCSSAVSCGHFSSGGTIGLLSDMGLAMVEQEKLVEHHWYTHFGTVIYDAEAPPTEDTPLRENVAVALGRLASYQYQQNDQFDFSRRVWVPPVASLVRYQVTLQGLAENTVVDQSTSQVRITSWIDPVTGRRVPDLSAGTRDLHGATIYVPNANDATILVDDKPINTFVRNDRDSTGQLSVTIVGDNAATPIIGTVDLYERGKVTTEDVALSALRDEVGFSRLERSSWFSDDGSMRFEPWDIELWNTTHLKLSYRLKDPSSETATKAHFSIRIEMEDGRVLYLHNETHQSPDVRSPDWRHAVSDPTGDWKHMVLSTYQFDGAGDLQMQLGPMLRGKIGSVEIDVVGLDSDNSLDLRLEALRPKADGLPNDGHVLLAGRVVSADDVPAEGQVLTVSSANGTRAVSTSTDSGGYYYFYHLPRGSLASVHLETPSGPCFPGKGREIELLNDMAEVDFDLLTCVGER